MKILIIIVLAVFFLHCGGSDEYSDAPKEDKAFSEIKPIIDRSCAVSGCHANSGFIKSGDAFRKSKALVRLENGSMPKKPSAAADQFSVVDKEKLLAYLR